MTHKMMKVVPLSLLLLPQLLLGQTGESPNLVPNGGFELVSREPTTFDQLERAVGWSQVTIGLPELFSPSAKAKTVGIPENFYGKIKPEEGERYAGFMAWKDDQRRDYQGTPDDPFKPGWNAYSEYPRIELTGPLQEGQRYEVSFKLALAGNSDRAVSGIGALVWPEALSYPNRSFLSERPQMVETEVLNEREKWVEVKGDFEAEGGERYLIIGVFPTAIFETERIIEGYDNQYAYYYLDEVRLSRVEAEGSIEQGPSVPPAE